MYARVSPLGLAWSIFGAITVLFLVITGILFQNWRIESAGVWSPGTITGITHCYSHSARLATVNLSVHFTDGHGTSHVSQTTCEYDRYHEGQAIAVRYLPDDPSHILIQADIGSGQGSTLIVMAILDVICAPLFVLATVYAIRRMRRADAERAEAARQQRERFQALREGKHQHRAGQRRMALPRRYRNGHPKPPKIAPPIKPG